MKEIDKTYILHLIDHTTRYSAAAVVKKKKKEDIAEAIIKNLDSFFWCPKELFYQIMWGEFNNELLREVCKQFNITMKSTVTEAPWSNGILEQHNVVLGKMIKKLKLDNDNTYPTDFIVSRAIKAKKALQACYGFSPNQLVFGKSTNSQSNLVNLPPAMEDASYAVILVKHLNAPHGARKAFIEAESNDKLHCALNIKNGETTEIEFEIGDMVYYKR